MTAYTQYDLIRAASSTTHAARASLRSAYRALNNAGEGYDPSGEIEGWSCLSSADTTDDVSAYTYTDEDGDQWLVLVGTDGTGSDDSRWAVRIGDVGVEID